VWLGLGMWKWHKAMQITLPRLVALLVYDVSLEYTSAWIVCLIVFQVGVTCATCLLPTAWKMSGR
jgi:hypothetical protein